MKKLIFFLFITFVFADVKDTIKLMHILDTFDYTYKPITHLYNPFKHKSIQTPIYNPKNYSNIKTYRLEVIFQNRVRINGNWYKIGEMIDNYVIKKDGNKIYLQNNTQKIVLTSNNSLIKVK